MRSTWQIQRRRSDTAFNVSKNFLCLTLGKRSKLLRRKRIHQSAFTIVGYRELGHGVKAVIRAPASLANETARRTVSCESSEPSVGTRMCLNMVTPFDCFALVLNIDGTPIYSIFKLSVLWSALSCSPYVVFEKRRVDIELFLPNLISVKVRLYRLLEDLAFELQQRGVYGGYFGPDGE